MCVVYVTMKICVCMSVHEYARIVDSVRAKTPNTTACQTLDQWAGVHAHSERPMLVFVRGEV